jgi:hypothetical protein
MIGYSTKRRIDQRQHLLKTARAGNSKGREQKEQGAERAANAKGRLE